jgi:predicted DNA-binding transcriptional regulator YafY
MAQNKNAQIRYKALDKCFSNQFKRFYINDLIEYCSDVLTEHYATETTVSRRQIFDDIDFMKSEAGYDAPIESVKDGKKVFYRYWDPDFSILKKPLSSQEIGQLTEALETMSRLKNLPGFDWIEEIQTKINAGLNLQHSEKKVIDFEVNEFLKGIEFLSTLYQFILNKQPVVISYKSFKTETGSTFEISPYYLKQYNNRWFLFGWNHLGKHLQNLALDRIHSIEISQDSFIENQINFDDYFEDVIGVSNDLAKDPVTVLIALSENIIPYIKSKPIHGSQKINENILSLEVKLNYELEALILSYGENMQVIEPEELVNSLKNRISKINLLY